MKISKFDKKIRELSDKLEEIVYEQFESHGYEVFYEHIGLTEQDRERQNYWNDAAIFVFRIHEDPPEKGEE